MAVTGHLRPVGLRWPVTAVSVASVFASSARRSVCRNCGLEISSHALSPWQSALFSGSVAK